jgi:hypothetical protein
MTSVQLGATPTREPPPAATAKGRLRGDAFGADAIAEAKLHCSWGAPGDCLHVARAYLHESPTDPKRARPYQQLAVSLYARECKARDPVACRALSRLYAAGEGVGQSPRQARALERRSADLCRIDPTPPCAELKSALEAR